MTSPIAQEGRQCLHCIHYKPLADDEGADYGVCLRVDIRTFGLVVFEHYGCQFHQYPKGDR